MRCTFGRLNAGRYSSWKQGRLQRTPYQGLSFSAVSGSSTDSPIRARTASMISKSIRSSSAASAGSSVYLVVSVHITLVHSSPTMFSSGCWPHTARVKFLMRSPCQPGFKLLNQFSSVGACPRYPTNAGVRWNTKSSSAASASRGTTCTAVAPVPMMPTRLPFSLSMSSDGLPPVNS
ncbi:unannotated protein [freshwater metagenome]|uniref:Unannotated protein n=1 Tax=freshwater metagenome TaxID=449393 RepID=A0A6J6XXX0_9ZZZZ